jgi:putative NIF3 family GTP cyclohydrolase 1 type 2
VHAIEHAADRKCDLLFTHHDAWRSTDADLVDRKYEMVRARGLSLYASHDPLDKHPEVGTSVSLARTLGWHVFSTFCGELGVLADRPSRLTLEELSRQVSAALGTEARFVGVDNTVGAIAVIAGAGARPEWMAEAKSRGALTFVSGEALCFGKLYALEAGMGLVLAGHYATELPAVRAILGRIGCEFDVDVELIEDPVSGGL